jgi:hypothetical protein
VKTCLKPLFDLFWKNIVHLLGNSVQFVAPAMVHNSRVLHTVYIRYKFGFVRAKRPPPAFRAAVFFKGSLHVKRGAVRPPPAHRSFGVPQAP